MEPAATHTCTPRPIAANHPTAHTPPLTLRQTVQMCCGRGNTHWRTYARHHMVKNFNMRGCRFTRTPQVFTSLSGTSSHWVLRGLVCCRFSCIIARLSHDLLLCCCRNHRRVQSERTQVHRLRVPVHSTPGAALPLRTELVRCGPRPWDIHWGPYAEYQRPKLCQGPRVLWHPVGAFLPPLRLKRCDHAGTAAAAAATR